MLLSPPLLLLALLLAVVPLGTARAQAPGGGPPAVSVTRVETKSITETSEFVGRIQATDRVSITARVTAFLEQRLFKEGTEVREGDLLYRLERAPFEAAAAQQDAVVADAKARLANAMITLKRARDLMGTPSGRQLTLDDAIAAERSQAAQVAAAEAASRTARINLDYTEIRAPITGKISRTSITTGNVVSPSSGPLAIIVSQDPMYVTFPVGYRALAELQKRYGGRGGMAAVTVKLRLPDGSIYGHAGQVDYVDPTVQPNTDTILLRARIANPPRGPAEPGQPVERPLTDGAFVSVLVEGVDPIAVLGIPRAAVLADQQGSYVYVVGADNKVELRRVQIGQSTAAVAVIAGGLKEGEMVISEGLQRARPGIVVAPAPAAPRAATAGR